MKLNSFKYKALTWSLILGGALSAPSHAQIVLTDSNFPYNDRVYINSGAGTFGAGNVHIQNTAPIEINYAGPGSDTIHALSVEYGARLDVDNAISLKTGGSAGHALLVVGAAKAYFGGDLKAQTTNANNTYYTVGVTGSGSILQVNGKTEIIAVMSANRSAGFYNGTGSKSTFNGEVVIKAGGHGVYSLGTTEFNGQTYIEVQSNGANGLVANTDAAGSVTFNDVVTIKSTPVSDNNTSYNYGLVSSGNRVYLNNGGKIDMTHSFANASAVGVYATNSGIVEVKNATFEIDTTKNNGNAYALYAYNSGNIHVHDTVANIKGNFYANGAGSIISLKTDPGSVLDGDAMMVNGGIVNFDLNQTDWQLRSSSAINELKGANSHIRFAQPSGGTPVFNTLTINQLSGNGHVFYLNTELNDGLTQLTDKLVINNTASGHHKLHINDVGGIGTLTVQGIKVVDIQSTVTSNTAKFALDNTVVSNAYEYLLHQDAMDGSWYLSSQAYTGPGGTPIYRPDAGINAANNNALIDLSVPGFGYSGGKKWMEFQRTPENSSDFWIHANGSQIKGDAVSQVKYDADLWGVSLGGDKRFETSRGIVHIGAMANIVGADSKARNRISGSEAKGSVEGYAVGVYGTWYLSGEENEPVPYIDGLLSYGLYDNDVSTKGNLSRSYDADVVTASLQAGYPLQVTDAVAIEPQAQITYINVSTDDYIDHTATKVSTDVKGNLVSRVGAYVYRTQGQVRPYAALSVWYDPTYTKVYYTDNSGETGLSSHKRGAIVDARVGVRAQLNRNWDMWAEGGYRRGGHGYQNVGAIVGLNYAF